LKLWTEKERIIYKLLLNNTSKQDIAKELNLTPAKVYSTIKKMKEDLKLQLGVV